MKSDLHKYIANAGSIDLGATEFYAAILGSAPSKGARSPTLWNRAFAALGIPALMHPMDVSHENLPVLVDALRRDPRFLGGAVAVPYKQDIIQCLDDLEEEASTIGAVNSLYRVDRQVVGANSDGAAALMSIQGLLSPDVLLGARAIVLGLGGAGRAVSTYLARSLGERGTLFLANRTPGRIAEIAHQLGALCHVEPLTEWPVKGEVLAGADLLVNCTAIGSELVCAVDGMSYSLLGYSPLGQIEGIRPVTMGNGAYERFSRENHESIIANLEQTWQALLSVRSLRVYDIVYQPAQTLLLTLARTRGLRYLGGDVMNLDQAVLAFIKAATPIFHHHLDVDTVRRLMATP